MLSEINRTIGRRKWLEGVEIRIIDIDDGLLRPSIENTCIGLDAGGGGRAALVRMVRIPTGAFYVADCLTDDAKNTQGIFTDAISAPWWLDYNVATGWDSAIPHAWSGRSVVDEILTIGNPVWTCREGPKLGLARFRASVKLADKPEGLMFHPRCERLIDDLLRADIKAIEGESVDWADHSVSHTIDAVRYAHAFMVRPQVRNQEK